MPCYPDWINSIGWVAGAKQPFCWWSSWKERDSPGDSRWRFHFSRNDFLIVVGAESRLRAQIYSLALGVIPGSSAWSQFLQLCHWNCQVSIRTARCRGNSFHEGALTITSRLHTPGGITVKFRGETCVDFTSPYICFTSLLPFRSGNRAWGLS